MFVATLCCLGSKVICGLNVRPDSDIELRSRCMDLFRARLGASLIRERLSVWRAAARGFQWYPLVMVMVRNESRGDINLWARHERVAGPLRSFFFVEFERLINFNEQLNTEVDENGTYCLLYELRF
jgi:hypothetical protein